MSRSPDPWWVVASQWLMLPFVTPIIIFFMKDEIVWPQWLAFLLSSNYDPADYEDGAGR